MEWESNIINSFYGNHFIKEKDLKNLVLTILEKENLLLYCNKVTLNDEDKFIKKNNSYYDSFGKSINIEYNNSLIDNFLKKPNYYNIMLITLMFHEIEHVKQTKNVAEILNGKNNITQDDKMLLECNLLFFYKYRIYEKNYNTLYDEYNAIVNEGMNTIKFIDNLPFKVDEKVLWFYNRYLCYFLKRYYKVSNTLFYSYLTSPYSYHDKLFKDSLKEEIYKYYNLNLHVERNNDKSRLISGMPLTKEDINYILSISKKEVNETNIFKRIR